MKDKGYERLAVVDGDTDTQERKSVLERLKLETISGVDIVIANSAFGLGIDCDDVRSIVHACVPRHLTAGIKKLEEQAETDTGP